MDAQREALRSVFDAAADSYDQVGVDFFQPIAAGLVAELDPQPGERALDLGCGRGAALFPIARAVGPTGFAVGGDLSPVMVAHTTALAAEEGLNQVEVLVMDAQEPDLAEVAEDGFDLLSASMVLFFLPDPLEALARWRELARPGGRVGVATFGPPDPTWKSIDDLFQPYLPPQLLDARTSGAAGPFGSAAGVEGLFTTAGWSDPVSADVASRGALRRSRPLVPVQHVGRTAGVLGDSAGGQAGRHPEGGGRHHRGRGRPRRFGDLHAGDPLHPRPQRLSSHSD